MQRQGLASCSFPALHSLSQRWGSTEMVRKPRLLRYAPEHGHQQVHQEDVGGEHVNAHQGNGDPLWEAGLVVGIQLHTQGLGLVPRKSAVVEVVGGTSESQRGEPTVSSSFCWVLPSSGPASPLDLEARGQHRAGQPLEGQTPPRR